MSFPNCRRLHNAQPDNCPLPKVGRSSFFPKSLEADLTLELDAEVESDTGAWEGGVGVGQPGEGKLGEVGQPVLGDGDAEVSSPSDLIHLRLRKG